MNEWVNESLIKTGAVSEIEYFPTILHVKNSSPKEFTVFIKQ